MTARSRWWLLAAAALVAPLLAGCGWEAAATSSALALLLLLLSACGARTSLLDGEGCGGGACPGYMTCTEDPERGPWCMPDADEDGVPDDEDSCPWVENADQRDRDDDGLGDGCDGCDGDDPIPCGPGDVDSDGDGVLDWPNSAGLPGDNCPYIQNPDQSDRDFDFFGDVCDLDPDVPNMMSPCGDPDLDSDGDGLADYGHCTMESEDSCPTTPSAGAGDHDGDGVADVCDPDGIPPLASASGVDRDGLRRALLLRLEAQGVLEPSTVRLALG